MIIVFFPVGSRAGCTSYLIQHRSDRAVLTSGDSISFSWLKLMMETNNPVTTGAVCFHMDFNAREALEISKDFVGRCLLGGGDVSVVPRLFVVHREPFLEGNYRTVVHWIVANVHLGLRKSIRPYVHARDFNRAILPWQDLVNRHYGWPIPDERKAEIKFARSQTPFGQSVVEVVRHGLNVVRATGHFRSEEDFCFHLTSLIENFNADGVWDNLDENGDKSRFPLSANIIQTHEAAYTIRFTNSITVPICKWGHETSRRAIRQEASRAAGKSRRDSFFAKGLAASFEEIARDRAQLFQQLYGPDWGMRRDINDGMHRLLSGVQIGPGGIQIGSRRDHDGLRRFEEIDPRDIHSYQDDPSIAPEI